MKVSLNWLKDYVEIPIGVKELAHLLTMSGLEVEGVVSTGEGLEKVVVAEILSVKRHPNADRLSLVDVKTDQINLSIVCGATNIKEGQRVPLALVGAKLPNGIEIKKSKIRGVASEGMLCSPTEIGLGQDATGILILSPDTPLGINLGDALGLKDTVFDISVTPNRPDCLCVIGIAREIAALTHQKLRYPSFSYSDKGEEIHRMASVTILDPDLCPRYVAKIVEGVTVGPSPQWMKDRLEKVGVRSISNVVDVTNYIMMEYGQPLHAFDFNFLEEKKIVVRRAGAGESFVSLDGVTRTLDPEMLMICDGVKPVAIAGVMGGLNSEIKDETKTVLLESAYFNPVNNRNTSRRLGLETEASYRFGRGIDYGACLSVAHRAAQLMQELAGGRVVEGVIDVYPRPIQPKSIRLSLSKVGQILGTVVSEKQVKTYLTDLELDVREEGEGALIVNPPTFRGDLEREIDLIEEVARMDGFEKIPATIPKGAPALMEKNKELLLEKTAKEVLVHNGYYEAVTYSFTSPNNWDKINLAPDDPKRRHLQILNPLTEDFSVLRTTLIPGLLETAGYNAARKNLNLKLFELRKVFLPREGEKLPKEVKSLSGLAMGFDQDPHWASALRPVEFYDVKGCLEDLLEVLQIKNVAFGKAKDVPYLHPGKALNLIAGEEILGVMGEVHPDVLAHYEISGSVFLFEVDFDQLVERAVSEKQFHLLPKFPAVYRDLSVVVENDLETDKVTETIWAFHEPYIDEVRFFDLYQGTPIPEGKKGVSYRIRYQAEDRTLTDEEVNQYHDRVISRLKEIFQVELRK
jgi:phenylalanyl-tRNA synthetase beta chain